jgi:hypothetical protein
MQTANSTRSVWFGDALRAAKGHIMDANCWSALRTRGIQTELAMKILDRKTQKAIRKVFTKVIRKHAPEIAAGLAGSLSATLATLAGTDTPGGTKKSNLAALSETLSDMVTGGGKKSRKKDSGRKVGVERGKRSRPSKRLRKPQGIEPPV